MKKIFILLTALSCCLVSFAQNDAREPGLYAIVGENSIRLSSLAGITANSGTSILGIVEVGSEKYNYKGATSNVKADSTFVMVCDMEKTIMKGSFKNYDVFIKSMTPDNMIVVPLEVKKNKRFFDKGTSVNGIHFKGKKTLELTWEQISDNSYLINVHGLIPGEYAFVFRAGKLDTHNFSIVYDFTIPEPNAE